MDILIPFPKHIIPNHPFYFFAFGKKVVDGKNEVFVRMMQLYEVISLADGTFFRVMNMQYTWQDVYIIIFIVTPLFHYPIQTVECSVAG